MEIKITSLNDIDNAAMALTKALAALSNVVERCIPFHYVIYTKVGVQNILYNQ